MTDTPQAGMAEATRLTRAGRLSEATALIQRLLHGGDAPPQPERPMPAAPPPEPQPGLLHRLMDGLRGLVRGEPEHPASTDATGGRFVAASFTNAAGTRAYKLFIPAAAGERPLPLVVMLHGCTQSPDDFAAGTGMNRLAEEHGCYVAYPAQDQRANPQRCWNWFQPGDQARDGGEPSLIAGIAREIMAQHRVDPARVYVAGLSAGGAQASIMAAAYPDLFAAAGVHSGLACGVARDLPSALTAMRQGPNGATTSGNGRLVPTIVFHGDQDRTVNPLNGDHVLRQALGASAGLRSELEEGKAAGGLAYSRTVYQDSDGRAVLERWTVHGAGHAWSGGSPDGTYTDPRGPDASREMLRFFLAHRRDAGSN
jgi:poly(hydroxyalkanoate) depolymerase family esterase